MIIAVASGKGGTGKTTVAVNLALSIEGAQVLDCDAEEPNAHLFLSPEIAGRSPAGIPVPEIDTAACDLCGKCAGVCAFHALAVLPKNVMVFEELCHGCGGCTIVCPRRAIRERVRTIGEVRSGTAGTLLFADGALNPGEPMAPPLIRSIRARTDRSRTTIVDAPPGTGCPAIAAVAGADVCLLVTEPTPFGLHDLRLAVRLVSKLGIPHGVVVNRADGNDSVARFCASRRIPVLMEIPFARTIAERYSRGIPFAAGDPVWRDRFRRLFADAGRLAAEGSAA